MLPSKYFALARKAMLVEVCGARFVNNVARMVPQFVLSESVAGIFFAGEVGCLRVAGTCGFALVLVQDATDVGRSAATAGNAVAVRAASEITAIVILFIFTPTQLLQVALM